MIFLYILKATILRGQELAIERIVIICAETRNCSLTHIAVLDFRCEAGRVPSAPAAFYALLAGVFERLSVQVWDCYNDVYSGVKAI